MATDRCRLHPRRRRCDDGDPHLATTEASVLAAAGLVDSETIRPKQRLSNTFAAAAETLRRDGAGSRILANCFGPGSEQASFVLEGP